MPRIAARMSGKAVGLQFEQGWPLPCPCPAGRFQHCPIDFENIVAVHGLSWNAISRSSGTDRLYLHHRINQRGSAVFVVLANEHDRQIPDSSHVDRLVEDAFIDRSVPKETGCDAGLLEILERERIARGQRNTSTHNGDGGQHAKLGISHVHRSPLAMTAAR